METNKMAEIIEENEAHTREDLFWDAYEYGYQEATKAFLKELEKWKISLEEEKIEKSRNKISDTAKEILDFLEEVLHNDYE